MERLDFLLPDFVRRSWVSDAARDNWEPRLQRIGKAWFDIEWRAVLAGVRQCGVTIVSPQELVEKAGEWARHGLNALPVEIQGLSTATYASTGVAAELGKPFVYRVVIGTPGAVAAFKEAWDRGDHHAIGQFLGYPDCCHRFFYEVWVADGMVDTTWPMALRTDDSLREGRTVAVTGPPEANILWRWMGVRAVPHLPCSFTCRPTESLGQQLIQVGRDAGYQEEMDWLLEILNWPVAWSALHGIAEIKTPILKVSTRTDATPHTYTVRRRGPGYPADGARGLGFPYRMEQKPALTGSAAFRRGLDNPVTAVSPRSEWLAGDNGFQSVIAMEKAHRPIIALAKSVLANGGTVLDLGCGNGALLQKISASNPDIIPFGCDLDPEKVAHARSLQPTFADNFICMDMFDPDAPLWQEERPYTLIILMPGRLLEVPATQTAALKKRIQDHATYLLTYAYGDWLTRYQNLHGLAAAVGLKLLSLDTQTTAGLAVVLR